MSAAWYFSLENLRAFAHLVTANDLKSNIQVSRDRAAEKNYYAGGHYVCLGYGGGQKNQRHAAQCWLARLITSDRAPTKTRLTAQAASRLNQLRDTNLRPR